MIGWMVNAQRLAFKCDHIHVNVLLIMSACTLQRDAKDGLNRNSILRCYIYTVMASQQLELAAYLIDCLYGCRPDSQHSAGIGRYLSVACIHHQIVGQLQ